MNQVAFDEIARVLPEPMLLVQSDGEVLYINPAALHLLNQPHADLVGGSLHACVDEPPEQVDRYLASCVRSRQLVLGALSWRSADGTLVETRSEGAVVRPWTPDEPGLVLLRLSKAETASQRFTLLNRTIEEMMQEVHVRRQAEERLAFIARASEELGHQLDLDHTLQTIARLLVPRLADWGFVVLSDGRSVTHYAAQHQEAEHHALVAQVARHAFDVRMPFAIRRALRSGAAVMQPRLRLSMGAAAAEPEACLRRLHPSGDVSLITVPMPHRLVQGALVLVRSAASGRYSTADLSLAEELARRASSELENAQLYHETEVARLKAEEASRLQNAFLASMSHEIRTPLTSIIGFASILSEHVSDHLRDFTHHIASGGRRLMQTLDAVLALAQLEAEQMNLKREVCAVAGEVRDALHLFEPQAAKKGLALHFHVDPGMADARAMLNRGAFSSIVQNLVDNAIKYTEAGAVTVRVTGDDEQVHVSIEDTGIGIEEEFLKHIFEPFRQESSGWGRTHEGVGLGLSITGRLVEHLGGRIAVESEKGTGSRFTVTFGRVHHVPAPRPAMPLVNRPAIAAQMLAVEDTPQTQRLLQEVLGAQGAVEVAASVEEALETVARFAERGTTFDLVLVDIHLGRGATGEVLVETLRKRTAYRDVPFVALTAYAMPGDQERLLASGFDAYIPKPFDVDVLLGEIQRLLQHGRSAAVE